MADNDTENDANAASEGWNDADFLSLDNDEKDQKPASKESASEDTLIIRGPEVIPPWMERDAIGINPLVALHNEIVGFCKLMEPLPEEIIQREELVDRISSLIYKVFGADKCQVIVFGSQATGLCLPTSDIDLVVQFAKKAEDDESDSQEKKATDQEEMDAWTPVGSPIAQLAEALRSEWRNELSYLEAIENTRIPIVKFTHAKSNIQVDICVDQETGPKAAQLMKTYMQALPPLRPLTFVLKYFMAARGINEPYSGGVGSFMLQLMIVSFLQHRERDGYNFNRPSLANLGCLLLDFLELYGVDFNYVTTGISVQRDGYYFPKGQTDRRENFWQPGRPVSLALENPLEPAADVGRATFRMQTVQRSFEVAYKVLLAHLSEPMLPSASKLASILPPTVEMVQRAKVKSRNKPFSASRSFDSPSRKRQDSSDMETSSEEEASRKRRK